MRVFITGGMGFVGSHIVVALIETGDEVTVLARDPNKVPALRNMAGVSVVKGGLDDHEVIRPALEGHDVCIHNALYWDDEPTELQLKDTRASVALFESAAAAGVQQLIYTSSTAVHRPFQPLMDETMRLAPTDFYGATKAASEVFLSAFSHQTGMRCNTVRLGPTIGTPIIESASMVCDRRFRRVVGQARSGGDIAVLKGDGRQFIWARDAARLYVALAHAEANRETYIATSRNFTTWEQIANEVVAITGSSSQITLEDPAGGSHLFDVGKVDREFGLAFDSTTAMSVFLRYLASAG